MTDGRVPIPSEAVSHLRQVDPVMAGLIDRLGPIDYGIEGDVWRSVVGSIIGQQLSVRAASTIRARVATLGRDGFPEPKDLLEVPEEVLRGCGLSRAKASYVRDAALAWTTGRVNPATLSGAPDEQIIETLTTIRGVGRWTAEMVLIFCLGRPDVLAVDDLGIRTAVAKLHGLGERPARELVRSIGAPWAPYRSYASLYLWRSLA